MPGVGLRQTRGSGKSRGPEGRQAGGFQPDPVGFGSPREEEVSGTGQVPSGAWGGWRPRSGAGPRGPWGGQIQMGGFPCTACPPATRTRGGGTSAIGEGLWRTEQEDRSWET